MNRYLGNATLFRHTIHYNKLSGGHYIEQNEVLLSMRVVRGTPLKAINVTIEKVFVSLLAY